jgi:hypothetical protein
MKVLDPGHCYEMDELDKDDNLTAVLQFVKREGKKYPGNIGHYPGVTSQEVLRVLIDRAKYVNAQVPDIRNLEVIKSLRTALVQLEYRARDRAGVEWINPSHEPELLPFCSTCGHIWCDGSRHE